MHTRQVIHRDLKLGNLFLDADMNIRVGDFGLAGLLRVLANGRRSSVERRIILRRRYCLTRQTDTASRLTPGPLALSYTLLLLTVRLPDQVRQKSLSVGSLRCARQCFAKHTLFQADPR